MSTYDIIIIGSGLAGSTFAFKTSNFAKVLVIEARNREDIPLNTHIYPEHNKAFLKHDEINYSDKSLFPCIFQTINYMDKNQDGIIDSNHFGRHFGHISYTENVIKHLLDKTEDKGGVIHFNERISKINRSNEKIEVINNKGDAYSAKLIALATGSHSFELQKSLGFNAPDNYYGIYTHLYGDEDVLKANIKTDYTFHINPSISNNGPLFLNRGVDRVSIGFLGSENVTFEELNSKFERILKNYDPIQPLIKGLKRENKKPAFGKVSKHPIREFSNNRAIVLGEAAGLVTALFYEGLLGCVASAEFATKIIKPLIENNCNFTKSELGSYDQEIRRVLLNAYFKTGEASEILFYKSGSKLKTLWDVYTKFIKTNNTIQKYIWEAIIRQDIENHDLNRDRWTGEQIFKNLPLISKATYWPHFLKSILK